MLIDLHVRPGPQLSAEAVASRVAELGLDGAVIASANEVAAAPPRVEGQPPIFVGAEVETDRGRYLVIFPQAAPPLDQVFGERPWTVRDVVARTHALQGAVVALAPYDATIPHPGGDILYTLPGLAAVQTVSPGHPASIAHPAIEAAEVMGLPCVGASDAKVLDEVGRAATLFSHDVTTAVELIAALRAGACWPVEFAPPSSELLIRGRSGAPREASPRPSGDGDRQRHRRRR